MIHTIKIQYKIVLIYTNTVRENYTPPIRQDKTVLSCVVCGVNRSGDKSRLFSVVMTAF